MLRSSARRAYPQFRRLIVPADGDVRQLADHTCDPVLTVIESVEVRQRSGQFTSVQIRNGIPWPDLLLPRMPDQFTDRSADISKQRPRVCGCRISRRPPQPAAARRHPGGFRRTGPGGPGSGATSRTGQESARLAQGVTFRGIVVLPVASHGPESSPSIRALTVPPPLPDSANWPKQLAEPVPAPERLSTGAGSASCPRPGQGQDRNPAQRER
jgi:hypothetical protein